MPRNRNHNRNNRNNGAYKLRRAMERSWRNGNCAAPLHIACWYQTGPENIALADDLSLSDDDALVADED
jgi:hypothetical protein